MKKSLIIEIISSLIAVLFVYAAISKLLAYDAFGVSLSQSPFITGFANIIVWSLPVIEIIISALLALPALRLYGLYAALFLLSLFTTYLFAMLNFSYYIPCSCGGILSALSWKQHILLNLGFIILSFIAIQLTTTEHHTKNLKSSYHELL